MKRLILTLVVSILFLAGCGQSAQASNVANWQNWQSFSGNGLSISHHGNSLVYTFLNCELLSGSLSTQREPVTPGQTYTFSVKVQGGNDPHNIGATIDMGWVDAAGHDVGHLLVDNGPIPVLASITQYKVSGIAPAGAVTAVLDLGYRRSSTTNSGTITWSNAQFVTT